MKSVVKESSVVLSKAGGEIPCPTDISLLYPVEGKRHLYGWCFYQSGRRITQEGVAENFSEVELSGTGGGHQRAQKFHITA